MRKNLCIFLLCVMIVGLCACGGNISNVKTHRVDSEIYSQEDISSAIKVIKMEFALSWDGCTLTEIYYAGDHTTSSEFKNYAERYDADDVIVLLSSFDVDSSGGDGSLNPNSTYSNWNWILVRNAGGQWKHVEHGY